MSISIKLKKLLGSGKLKLDENSELDFSLKEAEHLYVGYFKGTEKEVRSSIDEFIQAYVRDNELSKSKVYYNIETVLDHPYFDDGFVFEIHEGGDSFSYLTKVLSVFAEKTKTITFPLTNGRSVSLKKKPGNIDAYLNASEEMAGDVNFASLEGRSKRTKRLFSDSYIFYYVSLVTVIVGVILVALAATFKFVIYKETKVYESADNVAFVTSMPDEVLKTTVSTDTEKLTSFQYSSSKGWFMTFESRNFDTSEIEEAVVSIGKDGKLTRAVKSKKDKGGERNDK
jgi:hypothetical protein